LTENNYYEAVLNFSAGKIFNELKIITESDEKKKNEIRRRWIWELIQNASDCTPKGSTINITLDISDTKISFSHDGMPFSYDNLFSLITQGSEKQQSEEKMTGKFGTGFMSTFLLSGIVEIEGTFIRKNGSWTDMNFIIDRNTVDYQYIRNKTEEMLTDLDTLNQSTTEAIEKVNKTKFIYILNGTPESIAAVKQGAEDLQKTLLYLLAFNEKINSINYNGKNYKRSTTNPIPAPFKNNIFALETDNADYDNLTYLLYKTYNNVTIACPVKYDLVNNLLFFLPIPENIPKLFCDFPLIGSEEYAFPIIINTDLFDVETDRNTIRDGNVGNKSILKVAVSIYKKLIDYCATHVNTRNEFNICLLANREYSGLQKFCYDEINDYIKNQPLIPINNPSYDYERLSYLSESGRFQIRLPKAKNEDNDILFWYLFTDAGFINIPTLETFLGWRNVFGGNYSFKGINSMLKEKTIININELFDDEIQTYEWLDRFYSLWVDDEGIDQVIKSAFVPTQDKEFHEVNDVYYDSNINEKLKSILFKLDPSFNKRLLDINISAFNSYYEENPLKQKDTNSLAKVIETKVNNILSEETVNPTKRKNDIQTIFNKLTYFFLQEPDLSEKLLPKLLSKTMLLSSPDDILRRLSVADKFEQSGLDINGLDELLQNQQQIKEIIANGDLNIEEIRDLLKHVVTSTPEMREYFEGLLTRSVSNVYGYLKKLPQYELPTTLEGWQATKYTETIFPVKKDNKDITLVIRPTDGDKLIFHGEGELEVLDSTEYELWTDNGAEQKQITLGDLLKTTGITRIPLRKL